MKMSRAKLAEYAAPPATSNAATFRHRGWSCFIETRTANRMMNTTTLIATNSRKANITDSSVSESLLLPTFLAQTGSSARVLDCLSCQRMAKNSHPKKSPRTHDFPMLSERLVVNRADVLKPDIRLTVGFG